MRGSRIEQAVDFLSFWFEDCEGFIELRAIRGDEVDRAFFRLDQLEEATAWAARCEDFNIYFGACTRKDDSSGKKDNLYDLPGLWVDFDFKDFESGEDQVIKTLKGFRPQPSLLVHSGGGIHAYWKFRKPVPPTPELESMLKGLCRHLHGDLGATDLPRILRVPGTWNHKYEPIRPVKILHITEMTHSPEVFEEYYAEVPPDAPPVTQDLEKVPEDLPERFMKLLKYNPRIRALWERDPAVKFPSGKQSDSEYAYALMWECGANGFSDPQCAAILQHFYNQPDTKALHPEKEARTLRAAQQGRERCKASELFRSETIVEDGGDLEPGPVIEMGASRETESGDAREQLPAEAPKEDLPRFPEEAYVGLAGEFAATYAERLESPQQFFYLDYLTFLGAIISPHVRLDSQLREEPRIYGVKVGESSLSRKSSSQIEVIRFFEPLREYRDDRIIVSYGAGSAEGLAKRMEKNPGVPVILVYDEFRAFVNKAGVQGSVLLPMVTSLFSTTVYDNMTKHSEISVRDAHLSIIAACTKDTFITMFKPNFRAIGLLNRLLIVTGRREKIRPIPKPIPENVLERLRKRTEQYIMRAEKEKPAITFTAEGQQRWEEWYRALPESPHSARLDTYGLRLLMLFAITSESKKIDRPLVDAVIAFLEYEYNVRRELDPLDADNAIARMEQCILRHLSKGRMSDSRLQSLCHVRRTGVWVYEQAIKNLKRQGWIGSKSVGRGVNLWLTEAGAETDRAA